MSNEHILRPSVRKLNTAFKELLKERAEAEEAGDDSSLPPVDIALLIAMYLYLKELIQAEISNLPEETIKLISEYQIHTEPESVQ